MNAGATVAGRRRPTPPRWTRWLTGASGILILGYLLVRGGLDVRQGLHINALRGTPATTVALHVDTAEKGCGKTSCHWRVRGSYRDDTGHAWAGVTVLNNYRNRPADTVEVQAHPSDLREVLEPGYTGTSQIVEGSIVLAVAVAAGLVVGVAGLRTRRRQQQAGSPPD